MNTIGAFYELPDGSIVVKTSGFDGTVEDIVSFYREGQDIETISKSETKDWKRRSDLTDFPNAKNPKLPYVFDLFWDIKYTSEINELFNGELWWLEHEIFEIIEKLNEYGLSHLIPEKYLGNVVAGIFVAE